MTEKWNRRRRTHDMATDRPDGRPCNRPVYEQEGGMMEVENLDQFDREVTFSGCTIITVPGRDGFLWLDPLGQLHNAGMNIRVTPGTVQILVDDVTKRLSYGWNKE